jgi:ribonucleoside-diphosphate reductase alpha chain
MKKLEKYYWLNEDSVKFLKGGYLLEGEEPIQRFKDIAQTAEKYLKIKGFADKFEDYLSRGFYSISSPIISNFGRERGLPISCFGSYIGDCMNSIMYKLSESAIMTKHGGGTSAYFGAIRGRGAPISSGGESTGAVRFMEMYNKMMNVVSQGNVRRGSFAAYLPVDHPDIEEFLELHSVGHEIQEMSFAVCVSDAWMQSMIDGDKAKRKIWSKVIQKRFETGYPYIMFSDTVNNNAPQVYKDKGLRINNLNLCAEICLSNSEDESFVCDLSSINLLRWDELKDTDAIETMVYFLDAVMSEFIDKTEGMEFMEAPRKFALRQRALGVGVLGWHSLLQSKMISFESFEAKMLNVEIWKIIRARTDKATEELAQIFGEPELLQGYGRRNTTTLALAPTTSSSFIAGQVSQSIEPLNSNYYSKDLAKGRFSYRNPDLVELLESKNQNTDNTWRSILEHGGSVQHLEFLTEHEKDVFKTFGEISQKEIVIQAAQRQKYIDQTQSLNLMIPHDAKPKDVNELLIFGWEQGIKSFYYQRSSSPVQGLARNILTCKSCEA